MERVKVPDKVITYITLFCSGHGYYPHFVEYPHFTDIIRISCMYPFFVDIICMGLITRYIACNVHHVIHTYLIMSILSFKFTNIV